MGTLNPTHSHTHSLTCIEYSTNKYLYIRLKYKYQHCVYPHKVTQHKVKVVVVYCRFNYQLVF